MSAVFNLTENERAGIHAHVHTHTRKAMQSKSSLEVTIVSATSNIFCASAIERKNVRRVKHG